jgi:excisionase family DNA binding protein
MTVTDLAGYLNVSTKTIKRLVETGSVPSIRIGDTHRFDIHAVRRKIDGGGS